MFLFLDNALRYFDKRARPLFGVLALLFLAFVMLLPFSACRTSRPPVMYDRLEVRRDTMIVTKADTLRLREWFTDTITVENEKIKLRLVRDTVHHFTTGYVVAKPETVTVTKTVTVVKPAPVSDGARSPPLWLQIVKWGGLAIGLIIVALACWVLYQFYKRV